MSLRDFSRVYESWADTENNRSLKVKRGRQGGPSAGDPLTRDNCTPGSEQPVDWVCVAHPNTHSVFRVPVNKRTHASFPQGCPRCKQESIGEQSLRRAFPEIAAEWHPTANNTLRHNASRGKFFALRGALVTPDTILPDSRLQVTWLCCQCGTSWQGAVSLRTGGKVHCRHCQSAAFESRFQSLAKVHPELADEWDYERNDRLDVEPGPGIPHNFVWKTLTPETCSANSRRAVYWRCPQGNHPSYQCSVSQRVAGGGCEHCWAENLDTVSRYPQLAAEWAEFENRELSVPKNKAYPSFLHGQPLTAANCLVHSTLTVWWKCGHCEKLFRGTVCKRYREGRISECPFRCNKPSLEMDFPDIYESWADTEHNRGLRLRGTSRDEPLTRDNCPHGSDELVDWNCLVNPEHGIYRARVRSRTKTRHPMGCPKCKQENFFSVADTPDIGEQLVREWDEKLNLDTTGMDEPLTPHNCAIGSSRRVWWRCQEYGHVWRTPVSNRTGGRAALSEDPFARERLRQTKCPECRRMFQGSVADHPQYGAKLKKEWDDEKNAPLTAEECPANSKDTVWWRCSTPVCKGFAFPAPVYQRTLVKVPVGCPVCATAISKAETLAESRPDLAEEWHPTLNEHFMFTNSSRRKETLGPSTCSVKSEATVYWVCKADPSHEPYARRVKDRVAGAGCPTCAKNRGKRDWFTILRSMARDLLPSMDYMRAVLRPLLPYWALNAYPEVLLEEVFEKAGLLTPVSPVRPLARQILDGTFAFSDICAFADYRASAIAPIKKEEFDEPVGVSVSDQPFLGFGDIDVLKAEPRAPLWDHRTDPEVVVEAAAVTMRVLERECGRREEADKRWLNAQAVLSLWEMVKKRGSSPHGPAEVLQELQAVASGGWDSEDSYFQELVAICDTVFLEFERAAYLREGAPEALYNLFRANKDIGDPLWEVSLLADRISSSEVRGLLVVGKESQSLARDLLCAVSLAAAKDFPHEERHSVVVVGENTSLWTASVDMRSSESGVLPAGNVNLPYFQLGALKLHVVTIPLELLPLLQPEQIGAVNTFAPIASVIVHKARQDDHEQRERKERKDTERLLSMLSKLRPEARVLMVHTVTRLDSWQDSGRELQIRNPDLLTLTREIRTQPAPVDELFGFQELLSRDTVRLPPYRPTFTLNGANSDISHLDFPAALVADVSLNCNATDFLSKEAHPDEALAEIALTQARLPAIVEAIRSQTPGSAHTLVYSSEFTSYSAILLPALEEAGIEVAALREENNMDIVARYLGAGAHRSVWACGGLDQLPTWTGGLEFSLLVVDAPPKTRDEWGSLLQRLTANKAGNEPLRIIAPLAYVESGGKRFTADAYSWLNVLHDAGDAGLPGGVWPRKAWKYPRERVLMQAWLTAKDIPDSGLKTALEATSDSESSPWDILIPGPEETRAAHASGETGDAGDGVDTLMGLSAPHGPPNDSLWALPFADTQSLESSAQFASEVSGCRLECCEFPAPSAGTSEETLVAASVENRTSVKRDCGNICPEAQEKRFAVDSDEHGESLASDGGGRDMSCAELLDDIKDKFFPSADLQEVRKAFNAYLNQYGERKKKCGETTFRSLRNGSLADVNGGWLLEIRKWSRYLEDL